MAVLIAKGTKEIVPVDITDATGIVTDLSGLLPKFDFLDTLDTFIYTQQTATASGMQMSCLLDVSASGPSGLLAVGAYRLFVGFTVGTEKPRLGPIDIIIHDRN